MTHYKGFHKSCGKDGDTVGEDPAARSAAVFLPFSKKRGRVQTPLPQQGKAGTQDDDVVSRRTSAPPASDCPLTPPPPPPKPEPMPTVLGMRVKLKCRVCASGTSVPRHRAANRQPRTSDTAAATTRGQHSIQTTLLLQLSDHHDDKQWKSWDTSVVSHCM